MRNLLLFPAILSTLFSGSRGEYGGYYYDLFVIHRHNKSSYTKVESCIGQPAGFGPELDNDELLAYGIAASNPDACEPLDPPPNLFNLTFETSPYFAIIARGNCSFGLKVNNAQEAGFIGAVVYNYINEDPIQMGGNKGFNIQIPSLMITYQCAQDIMYKFPASEGYVLLLKPARGTFSFIKYLIPFLCVVAFCFLIMIGAMGYKLIRERRRQQRRRLSRCNLRKIPTKKFKKGEEPETCPICLDDFEEGEKLRVLPCKHSYHTKCVDPWLTKNRKVCPVCKRKVVPSTGDSSDSETEPTTSTPSTSNTPRPSAPLTGEPQQVGNSIFYPDYQSNAQQQPSSLEQGAVPSRRFVVPGFLRIGRRNPAPVSGSQERLVVPVAAEEDHVQQGAGEENPGFEEVTLHPQPSNQRRRRRHPANARTAEPTALELDVESNEENNANNPSPLTAPTAHEFRRKSSKKRRDPMKEKRERRERKITPASAPGSLHNPNAMMDDEDCDADEEEEVIAIPKGILREDSIHMEMDEDDTQGLVASAQPTDIV